MKNLTKITGALALSLALATAGPAYASKDGRNILLGAGVGALAGAAVSHGNTGSIVGGAAIGALAGHVLTNQHHHKTRHRVVYYRHGVRHVAYRYY